MDRRKSARNPWAIVLIIVAISVALAYGLATLSKRVIASDSFGHCTAMEIANIQDLQTTAGGFVYYDGSTVSSISSSGKVNWSYMMGQNAGFNATDSGVAVWAGSTLTLIDGKSGATTFNGEMEAPILSARSGSKYTAVVTGEEMNSTIVLMESGGKQVSQIILDDVDVINYGFFSSDSLLWVMVCDSNGTVPTCNIQTYRPGKEIVGRITDTQQLAYAVMFQSSQVLVAGDTYIKSYDYTGMEDTAARRLIYGWYLAAVDEGMNDPLMALVNDSQLSGASAIRDVRVMRSNLDQILRMPFGCTDIVTVGDRIYGFAADGHLMIAQAGSRSVQSYQLGITIDKVYGVTRDNVAVIGNGSTVYLVTLA